MQCIYADLYFDLHLLDAEVKRICNVLNRAKYCKTARKKNKVSSEELSYEEEFQW